MQESLVLHLYPQGGDLGAIASLIQQWRRRGYHIAQPYGPANAWHRIVIPWSDDRWRDELAGAVGAGRVQPDWRANEIECHYTTDEVAQAPLFNCIHNGRDIRFPTGTDKQYGICHIADVDLSGVCERCGGGVVQSGPLRLPAAEISKCGKVASVWLVHNTVIMLRDDVATELAEACGEALPLREVIATGRGAMTNRYWQLVPEHTLPPDVFVPHRASMVECGTCGRPRLCRSDEYHGGHYMSVSRVKLDARRCPLISYSPFQLGELLCFPDGRVRAFPEGVLLWRGDLARALQRQKVRQLWMTPLTWME